MAWCVCVLACVHACARVRAYSCMCQGHIDIIELACHYRNVLSSNAENNATAEASLRLSTGPWNGMPSGYCFDMSVLKGKERKEEDGKETMREGKGTGRKSENGGVEEAKNFINSNFCVLATMNRSR